MSRSLRTFVSGVVLVILGPSLAGSILLSQEASPPSVNEAPAKEGTAAKAAPKSLEVWVKGKKHDDKIPFTIRDSKEISKQQALNRMRLMAQNGLWDNLGTLSGICITYDDKDLLKFGHWYRALLAGRAGNKAEAIGHLKIAIKFGYKNAAAMTANESLEPVWNEPDFIELVNGLTGQLQKDMEDRFNAYLTTALTSEAISRTPWMPDLKTMDGKPFFTPGVPMIVVLSRIHHDGFPKVLEAFSQIQSKGELPAPVGVVFYQFDADDSLRIAQTKKYAEALQVSYPWAVVGKADKARLNDDLMARDKAIKELLRPELKNKQQREVLLDEEPFWNQSFFIYFPILILFDGGAAPVYAQGGVPKVWEAEVALKIFGEAVARAAPPKVEEPKVDEPGVEEPSGEDVETPESETPQEGSEAETPVDG